MKFLFTFLFFIIFLAQQSLTAQTTKWAVSIGDVYIDTASDVAIDATGNVYAVGYFKGVVDFNPGPIYNPINTLNPNQTKGNLYCVKLDPNGNLIWVKQVGGVFQNDVSVVDQNLDRFPKIALDGAGNVYVSGIYDYRVNFDTSSNSSFYLPNTSTMYTSFQFVCKLTSNGGFVWAKQVGGNDISNCRFNNMKVDTAGNVYMAGNFITTIDFDPGAGSFNMTSDNLSDIFFMKLDTNGDFVYAKQIGNTGNEQRLEDLSVDGQNLYLTGAYSGTVDFNPGSEVNNLTSSSAASDIFVAKYSLADGSYQWAKTFGSPTGWDSGYAIDTDSNGNVYCTGTFRETVDFNPNSVAVNNLTSIGGLSTYILKLNSSGEFVWVRNFGAKQGIYNYEAKSKDLSVNGDRVFVTGYYLVQMVDGNEQPLFSSTSGNYDISIIALTTDGDYFWGKGFGGQLEDRGLAIRFRKNTNDMVLVGQYKGLTDFSGITLGSGIISNYDGFILKMNFDNLLDVNETNKQNNITVYPNPTSDVININSKSKISKIEIHSADGKLILSKDIQGISASVNINTLPSGVYFVNTLTGKENNYQKIIKK
ncbi:T9SS type A sorting domain-containing protein [Chryseobacterium sp. SSA4.19]|uniref:T9SS type A sorting domain-containing protein n=1 Tax=Chryseobacterium sp. SSA4.19 TaxID=2919915 RepID=UPI001F4E5593|nr:T9SS type A sorting domain-containing protein [Chryseobacterium sp. SSA4.19]MCJ8155415.1 T9SS type A sorting domain-containing protein [Chryseobacterium sp. SSA4.19]